MLKNYKLGFIGGGQVCEAILSGALDSGEVDAANITITDVSETRLEYLAQRYGIGTILNGHRQNGAMQLLGQCDIVVLAIKPQFTSSILQVIGPRFTKQQLVISVIGAIELQTIESYITQSPVIRVMPNTPMRVRRGSAAVCVGSRATENDLALCRQLFGAMGSSYVIDEGLINAFTAVGGCGPAFAYIFVQALADGGVEQGLPRIMAQQMAAQMLVDAGELALNADPSTALPADALTPEQTQFCNALIDAAAKSRRRMDDLGKKPG